MLCEQKFHKNVATRGMLKRKNIIGNWKTKTFEKKHHPRN